MRQGHHDRQHAASLARHIATQELALFSWHFGYIRAEAGA